MFLSREIDIKLCQIYTKIHIYTILYKSSRIKQSKNEDIPERPNYNLGLLQL